MPGGKSRQGASLGAVAMGRRLRDVGDGGHAVTGRLVVEPAFRVCVLKIYLVDSKSVSSSFHHSEKSRLFDNSGTR